MKPKTYRFIIMLLVIVLCMEAIAYTVSFKAVEELKKNIQTSQDRNFLSVDFDSLSDENKKASQYMRKQYSLNCIISSLESEDLKPGKIVFESLSIYPAKILLTSRKDYYQYGFEKTNPNLKEYKIDALDKLVLNISDDDIIKIIEGEVIIYNE